MSATVLKVTTGTTSYRLHPIMDNQLGCRSNPTAIAAFLDRVYGYDTLDQVGIWDMRNIALTASALERGNRHHQVVLRNNKLWLVREISEENLGETVYFYEALKHQGGDLPSLDLIKVGQQVYALQEFYVQAQPCFHAEEMSRLAPVFLPLALAAHSGDLHTLNVDVQKFLSVGPRRLFTGIGPRPEWTDYDKIIEDLILAGLVDGRKGLEQFKKGLALAAKLDEPISEVKVKVALATVGWPEDEIETFLAGKRNFRKTHLEEHLQMLIDFAFQDIEFGRVRRDPAADQRASRESLLAPSVAPHVVWAREDLTVEAHRRIEALMGRGRRVTLTGLRDEILGQQIRAIIVEGGTACGKRTFVPVLERAIAEVCPDVASIFGDDVTLVVPQKRHPLKRLYSHAGGLGFEAYDDLERCFYPSLYDDLIGSLDFVHGTTLTYQVYPRLPVQGEGKTFFERGELQTIMLETGPRTMVIVKGKFQPPNLWARHKVPQLRVLVHAPLEVALARAKSRVPHELETQEELLFHSWYNPSFFRFLLESGVLEQLGAIYDSHTGRFFLVNEFAAPA
ncbi:MAG: hypothetical protein ABH823_01215 [bacterium]